MVTHTHIYIYRMAQQNKKLTDLPFEIHSKICTNLPLGDIQSLSLTNKHMLQKYKDMNEQKMDKITYNSLNDDFKRYKDHKKLKEIIFNLLYSNTTFEESAKFCLRNSNVETIKIRNIAADSAYFIPLPFTLLDNLTHLEITTMTQQEDSYDYLLPILDCTTKLHKLIYENGIFTRAAMLQLSQNENLKTLHLRNVYINNMQSLRELFEKLSVLEEFQYLNFHFVRLLIQVKIFDAIFDTIIESPNLRRIHVSAWQAMDMSQINQMRFYKPMWYGCVLRKGMATSFFLTLLPLMNHYNLANFEIFYSNSEHPNPRTETATLRYKLIDSRDRIIKNYKFQSEPM